MVDLRKVPHAFWSNYYRFSIRMVFAAYLLEMHIWCCLSPTVRHKQLFQNDKYPTYARKRGGGVEEMGMLGI